jgi:iron complex transport system substrate-binding protein
MVFALGLGGSLVGRSAFCDHPPEAASVEVIGGFADPSLEKIVSLRPTLVCGERGPAGPELVAALERAGIPTFFPPIDRVAEVTAAIGALAEKLSVASAGGDVIRGIEGALARVRDKTAGLPRPSVVMLFDWKPLVAAGPESFVDDVISLASAKNLVDGGGKYPKLSAEGLLSLDPDWILDGTAGAYAESPVELARAVPGLASLRALSAGRIRRLEGTSAVRPGPRIGEGIETVAKVVHGAGYP